MGPRIFVAAIVLAFGIAVPVHAQSTTGRHGMGGQGMGGHALNFGSGGMPGSVNIQGVPGTIVNGQFVPNLAPNMAAGGASLGGAGMGGQSLSVDQATNMRYLRAMQGYGHHSSGGVRTGTAPNIIVQQPPAMSLNEAPQVTNMMTPAQRRQLAQAQAEQRRQEAAQRRAARGARN